MLQELLEQLKVTRGFQAERWVERLTELEAGTLTDFAIPVAEGTPAQPGQDANFEWAIEITDRKPGKVLEDGSIDFRERNLTTVVKEGDLIGKLIPPKQGVPGEDIFGSELIPPQPVNIEVITDSRISAEAEEDGSISFFAEIGGGISSETQIKEKKNNSSKRISIGIYPISNIENDVDYSTGNIDFNGDVVIGGSVQPQFSVRATGSVTIGGYVETGAYITAGKDIMIKSGGVGASPELGRSGRARMSRPVPISSTPPSARAGWSPLPAKERGSRAPWSAASSGALGAWAPAPSVLPTTPTRAWWPASIPNSSPEPIRFAPIYRPAKKSSARS